MSSSGDALIRIGTAAADAVAGVLRTLAGDQVEAGPVVTVAEGISPLASLSRPLLASTVSYVDGVTGGNVFAVTAAGARGLAALMLGSPGEEGAELSELELSAIGEAANQMMAAAASATASVLELEVEISTPETRIVDEGDADPGASAEPGARVTSASFTICGEPARLVQFVPHSFVVRVGHAYDELHDDADEVPVAGAVPPEALLRVPMRLAAELGRVNLPLGQLIDLHPGALIELDRLIDEPVDVVVNGRRFATGSLLLDDNDEWAVRLEAVGLVTEPEGD
ncbi:MAG: FliM/FliN family flagellar motor switch protein [Actinobacteria bacterium]|nr:FliM/FliN family flagellar motor switch protein [Actinomycetota bacterium]